MALIHSKTPKAFKENIRHNMHAGKKAHMAEGGAVDSWTKREDNEKGINKPAHVTGQPGRSEAGEALHPAVSEDVDKDVTKRKHIKVLGEMRSMKKPQLYSEGGMLRDSEDHDGQEHQHEDAEQDQAHMDEEMKHMMGEELIGALDSKDKKRIMESIEAIVLNCLNKE